MSGANHSGDSTPIVAFSYAQAARGRSSAASSVRSANAPSGSVTPSKEAQPSTSISSSLSHTDEPSMTNGVGESTASQSSVAKEVSLKTSELLGANETGKDSSLGEDIKPQNVPLPLTPVLKSNSNPKDSATAGGVDTILNGAAVEPAPKSTSSATKPDQHPAKVEDGEKKEASAMSPTNDDSPEKSGDKSEKTPKEKALVDAPLPTINFWQQRAKEAKSKASSTPIPAPQSSKNAPNQPGPHGGEKVEAQGLGIDVGKGSRVISNGQDGDKTSQVENGAGTNKSSRKQSDAGLKSRDEVFKKPAPRSRATESKDNNTSAEATLPPSRDAESWPTPEIAQDTDKKKPQDKTSRSEKEKTQDSSARPHGKEKWIAVNYTPTAVFNTPLPPIRGTGRRGRGGRDGGGGRGGNPNGTGHSERNSAAAGPGQSSTVDSSQRGRNESGQSRAASLPPKPGRRSNSAGNRGEQRRHITPTSAVERHRDDSIRDSEFRDTSTTASSSRRTSIAQSESRYRTGNEQRRLSGRYDGAATNQFSSNERYEKSSAGMGERPYARSVAPDRRSDVYGTSTEGIRENGGSSYQTQRGGSERGRGGSHRSRGGGHNGFSSSTQYPSQTSYSNGQAIQQQASAPPFSPTRAQTFSYGGPSSTQPPSYSGSQRGSRGSRDPSRTQSIPHSAGGYGQFPRDMYGLPQGMAPLQTQLEPYDYRMHPASAGPPAHIADMAMINMTAKQLAYYFSVDNLCKDMYLRKNMDSQGFVLLNLIANFNRIRLICTEPSLLPTALIHASAEVEWVRGQDGLERLRKRNGWEQFVLDKAERDEAAQNDGPASYAPAYDPAPMFPDRRSMPPEMAYFDPMYPPYGMMPGYGPPPPGPSPDMASLQGGGQPPNGEAASYTQTPLSAAVPDFSPALPPVNGNGNGFTSLDTAHKIQEDKFTDEQIDSLRIVVRTPGSAQKELQAPFHTASSRTFSNGSLDGRSIAAEMAKDVQSSANGTEKSLDLSNGDKTQRSQSPLAPAVASPLKSPTGPSVFWIKDRSTETQDLPESATTVNYNNFRQKALQERQQGPSEDSVTHMNILFEFWSHFLVRNFNNKMYQEFRELALDDALQHNSNTGMKRLSEFYDACFLGRDVIADSLASHYYDLVKREDATAGRPGFTKLRQAWRNGALNMKTRKKMDNLLDQELRSELEA